MLKLLLSMPAFCLQFSPASPHLACCITMYSPQLSIVFPFPFLFFLSLFSAVLTLMYCFRLRFKLFSHCFLYVFPVSFRNYCRLCPFFLFFFSETSFFVASFIFIASLFLFFSPLLVGMLLLGNSFLPICSLFPSEFF